MCASGFEDAFVEANVFGWVRTIESCTHDDDRGQTGFEGCEMCSSIDTNGAARPDGNTGIGEAVNERARERESLGACSTTPYNGNGRCVG